MLFFGLIGNLEQKQRQCKKKESMDATTFYDHWKNMCTFFLYILCECVCCGFLCECVTCCAPTLHTQRTQCACFMHICIYYYWCSTDDDDDEDDQVIHSITWVHQIYYMDTNLARELTVCVMCVYERGREIERHWKWQFKLRLRQRLRCSDNDDGGGGGNNKNNNNIKLLLIYTNFSSLWLLTLSIDPCKVIHYAMMSMTTTTRRRRGRNRVT